MNWNDGSEDYNIIFRLRRDLKAAQERIAKLEAALGGQLPPQQLIARLREISNSFGSMTQDASIKHFDGCWLTHKRCALILAADTLTAWSVPLSPAPTQEPTS